MGRKHFLEIGAAAGLTRQLIIRSHDKDLADVSAVQAKVIK